MPSSAEGDTYQEDEVSDYFKLAWAKFYCQGFQKEAQEICRIYSALLERPMQSLMNTITEDEEEWQLLKEATHKEKRSYSVWQASNYLSDTACILFQFGREVEGKQFCGHAEQVQIMAEKMQTQEARYK